MSTDPIPHFDVDAFISDVEERPAIWDLKSDLYSDRGKKTEAWEELCLKFIPNFSEKNVAEKNKAASQLQRKWKSLRDCFKREHSKQMSVKSGSASSSRKPYIYYQQLSFLKNLADTRRDPSPLPNEVHDATERKRPKKNKTNNEDIQAETDILVRTTLIPYYATIYFGLSTDSASICFGISIGFASTFYGISIKF
ncbi:unnamed protein product [Plutella xylostella]|uniref:(diamondback moth) hypothetical protein n=1 Tax=Plutella xylostella TaxID=51655 RepID=A0A8S4FS66_PLUXY|nr:unnamed protein product [Plutella xylostella]